MKRIGLDDTWGSFLFCSAVAAACCVAIWFWKNPLVNKAPQQQQQQPLAAVAPVLARR